MAEGFRVLTKSLRRPKWLPYEICNKNGRDTGCEMGCVTHKWGV